MEACYGCSTVDDGYVREIVGPNSRRPSLAFVYQSTSRGKIMFCDVCFDESRFRELTAEDIESLTWSFGSMYAESDPGRAIKLLQPLVEKWQRSAEVLSPLGRAYINAGRESEGRALLEEALNAEPGHPNSAEDRRILAAV